MNRLARVLVVVALAAPTAGAASGPLVRLIESADLIVAGTLENGSISGNRMYGVVRIERLIQGASEAGDLIQVWSPLRGRIRVPAGTAFPAIRGVWFLADDRESWRILTHHPKYLPNRYYPAAETLGEFAYSDEISTTDKVVLELCAAADAADPESLEFGLSIRAFLGVGRLKSPVVRSAFERLADSPRPAAAALGLGFLLDADPSPRTFARLENRLDSYASTPAFSLIVAKIEDVTSPDPDVVRGLGRIATAKSNSFNLRRAAAEALRSIHGLEAPPFLAALLDDERSELRDLAVAGLSAFVRNIPIITAEARTSMSWMTNVGPPRFQEVAGIEEFIRLNGRFETEEERQAHVDAWKRWWDQVRLEAPACDVQGSPATP